jgi:hypothetical protein
MKDPKILPFGSWFKVYEQAGRNFKKSQQILESRSYRGLQRILEAKNPDLAQDGVGTGLVTVQRGNAIYDISDSSVTPAWGWIDPETSQAFNEIMQTTIGLKMVPKLYINAGPWWVSGANWSKSGNQDALMDVFKVIIAGIGRWHGVKDLGKQFLEGTKSATAQQRVDQLGLTCVQDSEFQLYGPNYADQISCSHNIEQDGQVLNSEKNVYSNTMREVCNYVNTFNIINFGTGNGTQYSDLAKCVDDKNVLQLGNEAKAGISTEDSILYFYSPAKMETEAAGSKEIITKTQGKPELKGSIRIGFDAGSWTDGVTDKGERVKVDADYAAILQAATDIRDAIEEGQQITKMTIFSSASPDWGGKPLAENPTGGSGDPSGGKITAADKASLVASPATPEEKNNWLGWKRGEEFKRILVAMLGDKRILAENIEVKWNVSKDGLGNGRNMSWEVLGTGVAPKEKTETQFFGAKTTITAGGKKMYRYKISWNYQAMTDKEQGWMQKLTFGALGKSTLGYGDLEKGDWISYYKISSDSRDGEKVIDKKLRPYPKKEVVKVESGKVYVMSDSGKELYLPQERIHKTGKNEKSISDDDN